MGQIYRIDTRADLGFRYVFDFWIARLWEKFTELTQGQIRKIYGRRLLFENKDLLLLIHEDNFLKNKDIF